eukprot:2558098-Rhodomonas_salina.3
MSNRPCAWTLRDGIRFFHPNSVRQPLSVAFVRAGQGPTTGPELCPSWAASNPVTGRANQISMERMKTI